MSQLVPRSRRAELTGNQQLAAIILRMISTDSLAAFAQQIGRNLPAPPVRGINAAPGGNGSAPVAAGSGAASAPSPLGAMPQAPGRPPPRGSLLDLRV